MREVAKYYIDEKFALSGRGLVLVGQITDGTVLIGNFIEFSCEDQVMRRKITGIEMIRRLDVKGRLDHNNMGLMIGDLDDDEINRLLESNIGDQEAAILENTNDAA